MSSCPHSLWSYLPGSRGRMPSPQHLPIHASSSKETPTFLLFVLSGPHQRSLFQPLWLDKHGSFLPALGGSLAPVPTHTHSEPLPEASFPPRSQVFASASTLLVRLPCLPYVCQHPLPQLRPGSAWDRLTCWVCLSHTRPSAPGLQGVCSANSGTTTPGWTSTVMEASQQRCQRHTEPHAAFVLSLAL